jgi:deoxyadenosine/deoxycytidine kinase
MWIAIMGSLGSGKQKIASMIKRKEGADLYDEKKDLSLFQRFEEHPSQHSFDNQLDLLCKRFTLIQEINRRMTNTDIVSVGILEEVDLFSEFLIDNEMMAGHEYDSFRKVFIAMKIAIQPPSIIIYLKTNIIDTHARKSLEQNEDYFTRNEFIKDLDIRYNQLAKEIVVPLVEVNLSDNFDSNWAEVEAGINSVKTARLHGVTLWQKQTTR